MALPLRGGLGETSPTDVGRNKVVQRPFPAFVLSIPPETPASGLIPAYYFR